METTTNSDRKTRVVTIPEYAAMKGVSTQRVKNWVKENRITTLRQNGKTIIDIDASEKPKETKVNENQPPSAEFLLQKLLIKAEALAHKNDISRKRWQLLSLVSLMLLFGTLFTGLLVYMETNALTKDNLRLHMEKYALTEQLQLTDTKIDGLSQQLDLLRHRNDQLAVENTNLRTQTSSLSAGVKSFSQRADNDQVRYALDKPAALENRRHQTERTPQDQRRLNVIQNGFYPEDMTKAELTAALGEPDRIYKDEVYEQLVYFDRAPGRFWFKNGPFLQTAE